MAWDAHSFGLTDPRAERRTAFLRHTHDPGRDGSVADHVGAVQVGYAHSRRFLSSLWSIIKPRETISDLELGDEMFGPGRFPLKLLPKVGHVGSDVMRTVDVARSPYIEKKLAVREHFALPTDQSRE